MLKLNELKNYQLSIITLSFINKELFPYHTIYTNSSGAN